MTGSSLPTRAAAAASLQTGRIVVLGDSLSVTPSRSESFPSLLQQQIDEEGLRWTDLATIIERAQARGGVPLVPFLLGGVALIPDMNGADGIHPNAAGAARIADTVWPFVKPLLMASETAA